MCEDAAAWFGMLRWGADKLLSKESGKSNDAAVSISILVVGMDMLLVAATWFTVLCVPSCF